jgi:hypothetical protein
MLRRAGFFVLVTNLVLVGACAQQVAPTGQQPEVAVASRPKSPVQTFRKTVGFMRVTYLEQGHLQQIAGTCFFVYYEDSRLGKERGFAYLVTNRHMAVPGIEKGLNYPVQQVFLRMNLKVPEEGRESAEQVIPLGEALHWYFPTDEAVDLAVLPIVPDEKKVDVQPINLSMLATKEKIESPNIDAGDSVIFAGYFYQFGGEKKIQPIVREGVLAMMPDEEIKTTLQKLGHLYLADLHAFHGNSGSPVLVNVGGIRNTSASAVPSYLLLGIISGYFPEGEIFSVPAATLTGEVHDNSGIATVVPAYELKALLDSAPLQAARDAIVAKEAKHDQP